jgi:hypothetical protein
MPSGKPERECSWIEIYLKPRSKVFQRLVNFFDIFRQIPFEGVHENYYQSKSRNFFQNSANIA